MRAFSLIACVTLFCLSGCGSDAATSSRSSDGKPIICVSIYPLADITQQLVGDAAEVICLLPPGQSPHGYEMTADQVAKLHRAKLLVTVGMGMDAWTNHAAAHQKQVRVLEMARALGIEGLHVCVDPKDHHHHHDGHVHQAAEINGHLWLNHALVREFIAHFSGELSSQLPDYATQIQSNAQTFSNALDALIADYTKSLAQSPHQKIITFHDAFTDMVKPYGITVAATLTTSQAPAAGVTVSSLEAALQAIRTHGVKVVYAEPQFSPDTAALLEREADVKVMMLDPLGDPHSTDRNGYLPLMRYNLKQLVNGLSQ